MYNVLFSFLKPQIAFGGDSGGGGGSSSGGGGGSRADRKGAQAILTTPKPAPRPAPRAPVVNTSRDRSDRKGAAAVMSAPRPAPVVSPATRAAEEDNRDIFDRLENIQLVSKDLGGEGEDVLRRRESQLNITTPPKASPVVPSNLTFGTEPAAVSAASPLSFGSGTTTRWRALPQLRRPALRQG